MKQITFSKICLGVAIIAIYSLCSCTENARARKFGGTETVELPKGEKLILATWKESNLWYLTEPMPDGYIPQTKTFKEKSTFGTWEGSVIFVESR